MLSFFTTLALASSAPQVPLDGLPRASVVRPDNPDGTPHPVTARLITDVQAVRPGGTARVGVLLEHHDDWHTYWHSNPDVGQPTEISWSAPEPTRFGPLVHPVPTRFDDEGIVSFGYHENVLLFVDVTIPETARAGDVIPVSAEASWLACKVSCIPARAILRTRLEVRNRGKHLKQGPRAPLFDHFASQHPTPLAELPLEIAHELKPPRPAPGDSFEAIFTVRSTGPTLSLPPMEHSPWPAFTPVLDSLQWMLLETEIAAGEAVRVTVQGEVFELDEALQPSQIGGLFQLLLDERPVWTEISVTLPLQTETDR